MEISPMAPLDRSWLVARSVETGWAQLAPQLRDMATREMAAAQVQRMLQMALSSPGAAALVAREGGVPVGYIIVAVVPDELAGSPVGLFLDIYVEPHWRGKGISSALTAAGEAHCRALGLKAVRRHVAAHNEPSLRHARQDGCEVERYTLIKRL